MKTRTKDKNKDSFAPSKGKLMRTGPILLDARLAIRLFFLALVVCGSIAAIIRFSNLRFKGSPSPSPIDNAPPPTTNEPVPTPEIPSPGPVEESENNNNSTIILATIGSILAISGFIFILYRIFRPSARQRAEKLGRQWGEIQTIMQSLKSEMKARKDIAEKDALDELTQQFAKLSIKANRIEKKVEKLARRDERIKRLDLSENKRLTTTENMRGV